MKLPLSVGIILGFAPYIAFSIATRAGSPMAGLMTACLVAAVIALSTRLAGRSAKLLELGSVALFGALAGFTLITGYQWSFMSLRLAVDAGLLLLVLGSLAINRPFTLQYAQERVPPAFWQTPLFFSVNRIITMAWAVAFAILVAAHAATLAGLGLTLGGDLLITVAALAAALMFSTRYPDYARRNLPAATTSP